MRCVEIKNPGPENQLVFAKLAKPVYAENELLIKVHATALNRADLLQRNGKYPPPPGASSIPGLEISGEVIHIGRSVDRFKPGDRVYALVAGGGYAEYCTAHQALTQRIPDDWSYEFAAAIPEALITAHATAFELGQLSEKKTILVHGAGSGIASTIIQMGNLTNSRVITTIGAEHKRQKAQDIGASLIINYKQQDLFEMLTKDCLDVIIDFIGGDYFSPHLQMLKIHGRLIQIACMKGHRVECSLLPILQKRLTIIGFVLRSQSIEEKSILWQQAHNKWFEYYLNKQLQPIIDSIYSLEEIEDAHARMKSSEHFGKIVIKI